MKTLTKAEEDIMQILWRLKKSSVKALIKEFPDPKPAYNTVSTIVRILENKGYVDYEKKGKTHLYFPLLEKNEYSNQSINQLVNNYFQGSFKSLVSFFVDKNDVDLSDIESLLKEMNDKKEEL
ncbi:BlaI/MecI/CopY family transcriptional regulator [Wenyingzhuangia marina]|uniref:Predicted transcriptional regulator n=1 Tax=Wenyingzhuangia marina TaxID=1195760 RepID=A0A1M5V2L9_9FLAO|nr:BlaI/MecI/CopY family transcriptional regulator [Wenyingzhuangia marina]GGF74910.1 transcriptional regulator [Wenyingzhuangia marina]SHH69404.1 Predicted transcriptional regulator [Wenyingzhuangia marina]